MWVIERVYCSGNQCTRNIYTASTRDEAIDMVLNELDWSHDSGLRFVMQDGLQCFEDQATCDLLNGLFEYDTSAGCHLTYHLRERI